MPISKSILLWLLIILLGAFFSPVSAGGIEDKLLIALLSFFFSVPAACAFFLAIFFIAGHTKFGFIWENILLILIHLSLVFITFTLVGIINFIDDYQWTERLMHGFGLTGSLVWAIGLFTSNNKHKSNIRGVIPK